MKIKPLVILTLFVLEPVAGNAGGYRTFPRLPTRQSELPTEQTGTVTEPVKFVLDHYFKIQSVLANDSMEGVASNASAIGRVVRADSMKTLPPEMAAQADALAKTKNLATARVVFKRLSKSVIRDVTDYNVPGARVQVYCPMAKASWLQQKSDKIDNPYMGGSMRSCGQI